MKRLKFQVVIVASISISSFLLFSCNGNKTEEPKNTETDATVTTPPTVLDSNKAVINPKDSIIFDSNKTEQNPPARVRNR